MIYLVILLCLLVCLFAFRDYKGYDGACFNDASSVLKFINPISCYLYDVCLCRLLRRRKEVHELRSLLVRDEKPFFVQRISNVIFIVMCGLFMAFAFDYSYNKNRDFGNVIKRSEPGTAGRDVSFLAVSEGKSARIDLKVMPREYTEEEAMAMFDKLYEEIVEEIPVETSYDIDLKKLTENDEVNISFISNSELIDNYGFIDFERLEEEETVTYLLEMSLDDYRAEYEIPVKLIPADKERSDVYERRIKGEILRRLGEDETAKEVLLPEGFTYKNIERNYSLYVILFAIIFAGIYFLAPDSGLRGKLTKRRDQMLTDYSELLLKLTLLLGCGMSLRTAIERIVEEYKKETSEIHFVYEELQITLNRMDSGYSQTAAYEDFAIRCKLPEYTRLVTILTQNLKKGNEGLLGKLEEEVWEAFAQRRNLARIKGEKASARLLFPMILMLIVVLCVVIIPVFMSF